MKTYLLQIIIGLSFVVSLLSFFYKYPSYLKIFSFYLLVTLFVELLGRYIRINNGNNHLLYSIHTSLGIIFFSFFYQRISHSSLLKTIIRWFMILYPIIVTINIFFIQGIYRFHTYTYTIGCIFIVFLCLNYFKNLIQKSSDNDIITNPMFWISTALLFFFSVDIIFTTAINNLWKNYKSLAQTATLVVYYLNYIMYLIFTLAFICPLMKRK